MTIDGTGVQCTCPEILPTLFKQYSAYLSAEDTDSSYCLWNNLQLWLVGEGWRMFKTYLKVFSALSREHSHPCLPVLCVFIPNCSRKAELPGGCSYLKSCGRITLSVQSIYIHLMFLLHSLPGIFLQSDFLGWKITLQNLPFSILMISIYSLIYWCFSSNGGQMMQLHVSHLHLFSFDVVSIFPILFCNWFLGKLESYIPIWLWW